MKKILCLVTIACLLLVCGGVLAEGATNEHGEIVKTETIVEPNCTETGIIRVVYDDNYTEEQVVKALGHTWDEGKVTKEPDCATGTDGVKTYTCTVCEATKTEAIKAAHSWSSESGDKDWGKVTLSPTCTSEGEAVDYCIVCGATREKTRTIEKTEHVYIEEIITPATCLENGKKHEICKYCGAEKEDSEQDIEASEEYHDWDAWVTEKEATCENPKSLIRWCKICGKKQVKLEDSYPADDKVYTEEGKLKPVFEITDKTLKDCFTEIDTYTCKYCKGKVEGHEYTEEVAVTAHTYDHSTKIYASEDEAKAEKTFYEYVEPANCTTDGYIAYKCIYGDPDEHPVDKVVIPAPGHKFTDWILRYAPGTNGSEYGYWIRSCTVCGETEEYHGAEAPTGATELKNGLQKDDDGQYRFYTNDKVDTSKTGIVTFEGGEFWVIDGVKSNQNGLVLCADNTFYFLHDGRIKREDSTTTIYDGETFAVKNGELDLNANGIYTYDTGKFAFAAGRLLKNVSGLWLNPLDNQFYYLANGQVQTQYTGVVKYDGRFFVVENGVLDTDYNGTIKYDGYMFDVTDGQLAENPNN